MNNPGSMEGFVEEHDLDVNTAEAVQLYTGALKEYYQYVNRTDTGQQQEVA